MEEVVIDQLYDVSLNRLLQTVTKLINTKDGAKLINIFKANTDYVAIVQIPIKEV